MVHTNCCLEHGWFPYPSRNCLSPWGRKPCICHRLMGGRQTGEYSVASPTRFPTLLLQCRFRSLWSLGYCSDVQGHAAKAIQPKLHSCPICSDHVSHDGGG